MCPPDDYAANSSTWSCVTHAQAIGLHDTLNYVWITRGMPTVLAARTTTPGDIHVDWYKFLMKNDTGTANSITFQSAPNMVLAVMFTQVIVIPMHC